MGGISVGSNTHVKSDCYFEGNYICIGNDVFINHKCSFYSYNDKSSNISIGNNVTVAMGVTFCTHTHRIGYSNRRAEIGTVSRPITVGEGTWIGANALILPGINIGKGSIIAAGAVVTENCKDNCLYAGVPAKKIKEL